MQDELDVLRSKAKKADAAERARRGFEDQMRRMEQKMQQHAEVKVKLNAMEQERDGLQQQRADLQEKLRRSDDKLRKVFLNNFPGKVFVSHLVPERGTELGLAQAVAELQFLKGADYFLGSAQSSFSRIVYLLRGGESV